MKKWFRRMGERLARMMYGRYGNDALNNCLLIVGMILLLLAYLPHMWICLFFSVALLTWSNVRCFSRNIGKRRKELMRYLSIRNRIKDFFTLRKLMWKDRKTHCYFKCKFCKAVLRVPKGKGEIDVTCRCCHTVTVKKT